VLCWERNLGEQVKNKEAKTGFRYTLADAKRIFILLAALLLVNIGLTPLLGTVTAATVSQRSLQIGSGVVSASTTYTYSLVPATAGAIQGLKFQACTTPIGTCTAPSGLSFSSAAGGTVSGSWTTATNFTVDGTGANNCTASASVLCAKRTQATAETTSGVRSVAFTTITNPNGTSCATINCSFFVRITTYSDNTWTTAVDSGSVASSTTQTLTVSATVQENLTFCVGSTTVDDATTSVPLCASVGGTSLNLGALNSTTVSASPVSATYTGDAKNGIAEIGTNASNGAAITYNAIAQSGSNHTGTLRVAGATCGAGAGVNTDQCINAAGTTQLQLSPGTERFGMTIAGINCSNVSSYTCTFSSGTTSLTRNTDYDCDGTNTYPASENGQLGGTTTCYYAWDETGTSQAVATSTGVIGNEALILKFAAAPNITTPTGSYTALANFVATPTF
jgi:hypothetical protein